MSKEQHHPPIAGDPRLAVVDRGAHRDGEGAKPAEDLELRLRTLGRRGLRVGGGRPRHSLVVPAGPIRFTVAIVDHPSHLPPEGSGRDPAAVVRQRLRSSAAGAPRIGTERGGEP